MIHHALESILTDLRNIREESKRTRAEIARAIDVAPSSIEKWERFMSPPNGENLVRWAEALGYEFDLHKKESYYARKVSIQGKR
jgi:transcriptional regulator with XRE-family HTH domain